MFPIEKACAADVVFCLHLGHIDFGKVAETIVKQGDGILIMSRGFVLQHHADQLHAVPFRAGHHAVAGRIGIAGLDSHQTFIGIRPARQQFHFGILQLFIGHMVVGQNVQPGSKADPAQHLIGKKSLADHGKIIGRGIVVFVRQSIGIGKMRIHTSQLRRPGVHNLREILPAAAADMLRHREGHLIGGADQNGIQTVLHGKLLPHVHGNVIAVPGGVKNGFPGKSDPLVQGTLFRRDQGGQNLGGAGRILSGVYVLGIQDGACLRLYQNGRFRRDHRTGGPARNLIALHGHFLLIPDALFQALRPDIEPLHSLAKQDQSSQPDAEAPEPDGC